MLPDVLLLSPAHLAADSDKQDSTQLLTLSAGRLSGGAGRIYVQAAIQGGDTPRVEGTARRPWRAPCGASARPRLPDTRSPYCGECRLCAVEGVRTLRTHP